MSTARGIAAPAGTWFCSWPPAGRRRSVFPSARKSVTRNKVKRRLRECFRPHLGDVKNGLYVIVARPAAAEATFDTLRKDVVYLLKKQQAFLHEQGTEGNRAR